MAGPAPTLDEVARLAGVSRATASRAVNGGHRVSAAAQQAVDEAVLSLGYAPNRSARALVTRRTDSVAVVLPEPDERVFGDPFFARTLRGVDRVLAEREIQLVLLLARRGADGERVVRYLSRAPVDGVLLFSAHRDDALPAALAAGGVPWVLGGRPWDPVADVPSVDVDNVAGGRHATQHLVAQGRRRVAHVAGPTDMTATVDRCTGWQEALAAAGLPDDALAHGDFTEAGGRDAARRLLADHPGLDAVFAASDLMARGVLQVLAEAGRRVPVDVAVVGYDDLGVAETCTPPLTTMRQPVAEMAERATRLLLEQVDRGGATEPQRLMLAPRLVVRVSA